MWSSAPDAATASQTRLSAASCDSHWIETSNVPVSSGSVAAAPASAATNRGRRSSGWGGGRAAERAHEPGARILAVRAPVEADQADGVAVRHQLFAGSDAM